MFITNWYFLITSCKNYKRITSNTDPVDKYVNNIGLNEKISYYMSSYSSNEEILNLINQNEIPIANEDFYVVDFPYKQLEITFRTLNEFSIRCINVFDEPIIIDKLSIKVKNYILTLPIDITLYFDSYYDLNFPFPNVISYATGFEVRGNYNYISFNPSYYGFHFTDEVVINSISYSNEFVDLYDFCYSFVESSLHGLPDFWTVDYKKIEYPFVLPMNVSTYIAFKSKSKFDFRNIGFDIVFILTVNERQEISYVHYLERF